VAGRLQVVVDALQGQRVGRHVPHLGAFSENAQVGHALPALQVAHAQAAEFLAPQPVVQERRQVSVFLNDENRNGRKWLI
jgi:hypothetical protein